MDIYYSTPGGGFGVTNDAANVPAGATVITQAQYDALVAAAQAAAEQAAADELAASQARWTTTHDALIAGGVTDPAATYLADAVGTNPAP